MRIVTKGATSQSLYFDILDSSSALGGRKAGLVYNSAGLIAYYVRTQGSPVAISLITLAAANSAWASGGFKEVDATNMPGLYRLDVPDAAFATGADSVVITLTGATGMVQVSHLVQLVVVDLQSAVGLADALLTRDMSAITGEAARSPLNALRKLMNKWNIVGGTLTVSKENDLTVAYTQTVTTSPGSDPVSGLDTV
jgi:hypothetical protein